MNRSMTILMALAVAGVSCAPSKKPACHLVPGGIQIHIGDGAADYGDLVGMLEQGQIDAALTASHSMHGVVNQYKDHRPAVCKYSGDIARSTEVLYPPKRIDDVGAGLEVYYDAEGRAKVAEFYVMPIAP